MSTNMRETRWVGTTIPGRHPARMALRVTLVALSALVALTAIQGAIFVLPTMPNWRAHGDTRLAVVARRKRGVAEAPQCTSRRNARQFGRRLRWQFS